MKFPGFIGPAYKLPSLNVDAQQCVNFVPEVIESANGKEKQVAYLKRTPGLEKLFELGTGPIRCLFVDGLGDSNRPNRIFIVSGKEVFCAQYNIPQVAPQIVYASNNWYVIKIGELETSTGPVSAAAIMTPLSATVNSYTVVFVDGVNNYFDGVTSLAIDTHFFAKFADNSFVPVLGATQVLWVDGYMIYNKKNTGTFYTGDPGDFASNPLSFGAAEGDPDSIVAMISNHRDVWMFNERSIELFVNTGNADFPFERVQNGFIEKGCLSGFSVAKIEGTVFWLGRDAAGAGIVYAATGLNPQRISTHAIEAAISTYANPSAARGYTYQADGHSYYVLNFDEATWVYDMTTSLWHERAYLTNGQFTRHRGDVCSYFPELGIHLVGDYQNGKIYKFNNGYLTDDGNPIKRRRACPYVSKDGKFLTHNSFFVDMETGVGLDGTGQGTDPKAMIQWSDDNAKTWSNEYWVSMGKIGKNTTRVRRNRLGTARARVYRIDITDPVISTLIDAQLELTEGTS